MLTFDSIEHIYRWDGNIKPSVTTILNEWIKVNVNGWDYYIHTTKKSVIPAHIFEAAGDYGTAVHLIFKLYILGLGVNKDGLHPDLLPALEEIERFKTEHIEETILCEEPLYSEMFDYCGTPDWFGRLRGIKRRTLLDVKTGDFDLVAMQLAAYEHLVRKETGYKGMIDHYVLSIPKSGGSDLIKIEDRGAFNAFKNRHSYYKRNERRK